jgi:hypothetical protein
MGITRFWVVAIALAGCGAGALKDGGAQGGSNGGEFSDPAIQDRCHESAELSVLAAERHCECLVAAGEHPDQATCVAERAISQSDIDCMCSTYARYPESNTFIDCFLPVQQAYADCIDDALCQQAELDACAEKYGYPQCEPPADAADEVAAMCIS